jgi:hypothetical protein
MSSVDAMGIKARYQPEVEGSLGEEKLHTYLVARYRASHSVG